MATTTPPALTTLAENLESGGIRTFLRLAPGDVLVHGREEGPRSSRNGILIVSPQAPRQQHTVKRSWPASSTSGAWHHAHEDDVDMGYLSGGSSLTDRPQFDAMTGTDRTRTRTERTVKQDHAIAQKAYERFVAALSRHRSSDGLSDVRRVVVILSSSRGGSSLLFYLLRATGQFLSLESEHTPLYKLYGFGLPTRSDASDADVDLASGDLPGLCQALVDCLSQPLTRGVTDPQRYSGWLAMRMVWQWPEIEWNLDALADETDQLAHAVSQLDDSSDTASHFLGFLGRLRAHGVAVDPWYYDLPASMVKSAFPGLRRPMAPPFSVQSIEEPPFVVPQPTTSPSAGQLASVPVLLKASIDAYRPQLLRAMFPNAVIKVIHLVRNPGAAINGLYDGWLHRGFYSHNLIDRAVLRIRGYSHLAWGRSWWNFDLPPGWSAVTYRALQDVCALQWCSAHEHILSLLDRDAEWPSIRVRAEDLIRGGDARCAALARICTHLGIAAPDAASWRVPFIMSTKSVGIGRWRARADLLASVLRSSRVTQLSARLGYHSGSVGEWI